MNWFFLQVQDTLRSAVDTANRAAQQVINQPQAESLFSMLAKGGVLMIPLALLLVATVYVFFERYFTIRKAMQVEDNFMSIVRDNILTGNVVAARNLAKNAQHSVGKVIDKGIQRIGKPIDAIERSMENVGKLELFKMEKNVNILSVIGYVAPLFGFLGTIVGMFQLFYNIASTGEYTISTIAGGIYVKMISSASGLIIGIIAYLGYRILHAMVDRAINKMESAAAEFLDILQEPTR